MRGAIATAWNDVCQGMKAGPSDHSIRVLVVLTDGLDNASKVTQDELIRQIGYGQSNGAGGHFGDPACKIPVFGIAFGSQADDTSLKAVSASAGGETRRGDSAEIREIFKRFSELL